MKEKKFIRFFLTALMLLFTACASVPRFTSRDAVYKRVSGEKENYERYKNLEALETVVGVASYYADEFNGRITYNGEIYDMYGLSAAHPSYQMETIIRVTNLSNDKSIIVRINDKMPYRPDRIIDLSLGSAEELDMVNSGITEVKVEVLEWGKGKK
ncbi:MAG: septal ring lytic transglycosylase RlpA family protein [Bacteroidota bacterium]